MDRFCWADGLLGPDERLLAYQGGVRLYDGTDKTMYDYGKLSLTTHRIMWRDAKDSDCVLSLNLSYVVFCEETPAGWNSSAKIICHLSVPPAYKPPGPVTSSRHNSVCFSFKDGGQQNFFQALNDTIQKRPWEQQAISTKPNTAGGAKDVKKIRTGIGGIEKTLAEKHRTTDKNITAAFEDLSKLMDKAKDMVELSRNISNKIREKQGDITEDETVRFKAYLLSLGIADPVTRDTHGSGEIYFKELAKQISSVLEAPLKECGGIMTLSDVYCRINRARGMELLSPDDLVNACKQMERLNLPTRLRLFESGVMVLQLTSHSENKLIKDTEKAVQEQLSLTADELSRLSGVSVILAKERLLSAEKAGKLCRDETEEGLRFYPNLFLNPPER